MSRDPVVYIVDDDVDLLPALIELIEAGGWPARGFSRGEDMLAQLAPEWEGVILSDIRMPGLSGLDLLTRAQAAAPEVPFILFTAHGDIPSAVKAIRSGAFDFIEKTAPAEHLRAVIGRAIERRRLQAENRRLKDHIARGADLQARLPGRSAPMTELRQQIAATAPLDVPVLLMGEPGTGKAQTARVIHDFSGRGGDFVVVECPSLTEANFDSRLIGTDGGQGAVEQAADGTLFLDRVSAMPPALQLRLVRLVDDLAGHHRARIIASVSGSLAQLRESGALEDELYYRLGTTEVELPPLRTRDKDVLLLLEHFIREAVGRHGRPYPVPSAQDLRGYRSYRWPGNLRELRNVAEKLVIGLRVNLPNESDQPKPPDDLGYDAAMAEFESSLLQAALHKTGGRRTEAARALGIPRKRLYLRMKACGLADTGQD